MAMIKTRQIKITRTVFLVLGSCGALLYFSQIYSEHPPSTHAVKILVVGSVTDKSRLEPQEKTPQLSYAKQTHVNSRVVTNNYTMPKMSDLADLTVHVATICCGVQWETILILLKSAIALTNAAIKFHIIADKKSYSMIDEQLKEWGGDGGFDYEIIDAKYPLGLNDTIWRDMNDQCSSLKLFLPILLDELDSVIYLDYDGLVLRPIEDLWLHLRLFSKQQLIGLAYDYRISQNEYEPEKKTIPYFIPSAVNTGLMLMNLTRMRQLNYSSLVINLYEKYKSNKELKNYAHQILNAGLHFHPYAAYVLGCEWDYRVARYLNETFWCEEAETNGVSVMHLPSDLPQGAEIFSIVFDTYSEYEFDQGRQRLLADLNESVVAYPRKSLFYKRLQRMLNRAMSV